MSKNSELKNYKNLIIHNGTAHLIYPASDIHGLIHPLSVENDELLSDAFCAFLEKYRSIIPRKVPIVLEITGIALTEKEKTLIDTSIWNHFCMHLTASDIEAKTFIHRSLCYLIYTVLSAILIFAVQNINNEILSNLGYLPFWFFGYRLLIFLILDSLPLWKNRSWYKQLASSKLIFTNECSASMMGLSIDEIRDEIEEYRMETQNVVRDNLKLLQTSHHEKLAQVSCSAAALEDLVQLPAFPDHEEMSETLTGYLAHAELFLKPDWQVSLEIQGKNFTEAEQKQIKNAVRNDYAFRIACTEKAGLFNRQQSLIFALAVLVSSVMVILWGTAVDVGFHEFIIMLFWFFGDYLLEFILITRSNLKKERKILENCRDMQIHFK